MSGAPVSCARILLNTSVETQIICTVLVGRARELPTPGLTLPTDPEQARRRLFDALTGWVLARGPALVVLEDLHWSDETTLAFLPWLARQVATQPLVVVLTYRSDDIHDPLRHTLAT